MIWSGLWWFVVVCVVVCGGLGWFVAVCGGLWYLVPPFRNSIRVSKSFDPDQTGHIVAML